MRYWMQVPDHKYDDKLCEFEGWLVKNRNKPSWSWGQEDQHKWAEISEEEFYVLVLTNKGVPHRRSDRAPEHDE